MKAMCGFFGISRAAYYAWRERTAGQIRDLPRMKLVEEAYLASRRTYGYRRIQIWLEQRIRGQHQPQSGLALDE